MKATFILLVSGASLLLAGCFPTKDFSGFPGVNSITVQRNASGDYSAVPPDCEKLLQPSLTNAPHNMRPDIAFGCATYSNLAAQVANPKDLVDPQPYAGQHADTAGAAVTRYRQDQIKELETTRTTSKTGG
jgi:type IV pilus biogenesis protein CpaD/CtpE